MYTKFTLFLLVMCACLISCRKPVVINSTQKPAEKKELALHTYTLEVGDIECDICAQTVEQIVAGIPGVVQVNFIDKQKSYEKGIIKIAAREDANLSEKNLSRLLVDNGFVLRKIQRQ